MKLPIDLFKEKFNGAKVTVAGLGLLGRGVRDVRFLSECGLKLTVTDLKTTTELEASLERLKDLENIEYILGEHREKDFLNADFILKSAAIPKNSKYLQIARNKGIPIYMDESLFEQFSPAPIIGITGTRGKTTTTEMIGYVLKSASKKVLMGGNLLEKATLPLLSEVTSEHIVILELSSWQLQGWDDEKISPHMAVFTTIYPDHLNYYPDMESYIDDKKHIYRYQKENDFLFLNNDQEEVAKLAIEAKSKVILYSNNDLPNNLQIKLPGIFNRTNAAAALQVARTLNINDDVIYKSLSEFSGVEHRLNKIRDIDGISFINDTTSTTPVSTKLAIEAYSNKNIHLICGGSDKKLDISIMVDAIIKHKVNIYLLEGTGTVHLIEKLKNNFDIEKLKTHKSLKPAVLEAFSNSKSGDVVLLSPGFASFGMFKNEYDRGKQFIELVKSL